MNPLTLLDLLADPLFQRGVIVGGVGLGVSLLARKVGWLLVWGVAAVAALAWAGLLRWNPASPDWALPAVALTAVAGAAAFRILLRSVPGWAVGLVFALWVLGVWGTVPDTERAAVVMGVTAAMLPALWPALRVRQGWEGAVVAIAALGLVAVTDGAARPISTVGALGMVGLPVAAAAAAWRGRPARASAWWLVAAQAVHVIVSGRIAGQMFELPGAVVVLVLSSLVTGLGLAWGVGRWLPAAPRSR